MILILIILFFISLFEYNKLIDNSLIIIIISIGINVQIISSFWFCRIILLLNLFFNENFIINIKIIVI